jgi:hypothetical protein
MKMDSGTVVGSARGEIMLCWRPVECFGNCYSMD